MKKIILIFLILFSLKSNANSILSDSTKQSFFSNFSLNFIWFEVGPVFPIKENKLNNLPYGMDKYFNHNSSELNATIWGLELWYKKIGLDLLFISYIDFRSDNTEFTHYISEKFPNYYYTKNVWSNSYSLYNMFSYRLNYKFHYKKFNITPKFQIGINDYETNNSYYSFKEKGSNQFIEYSIEKKSLMKNIIDYHFLVDISRKVTFFIPCEIGIKTEFITIPTLFQYTITEKPYGSIATVNTVTVEQYNPSISFALTFRAFIIK